MVKKEPMMCCDVWDFNRNMQTWKKDEHFFVIVMLSCPQLHWEKDKSYLLFETTIVYFSIMWLRMYEVIKPCHVRPSLAGLLSIWSITETSLTRICTCALVFNNKSVAVLYLPPIPRIACVCSLCGDTVWAHTALCYNCFSFVFLGFGLGGETVRGDQLVITFAAARTFLGIKIM